MSIARYGITLPEELLEELRENKRRTGIPINQQLIRAYIKIKDLCESDDRN